jgi:hypothetical protein
VAFTTEGLNFDEADSEWLHEKHAVATWGTWKPSEHLLEDREKPKKTWTEMAGRRTFRMHTDF